MSKDFHGAECNVMYIVQLIEKERLLSSLRGRTDSESTAGDRHPEMSEQSVQDFSERVPLIESLQRELSSAQVRSHLL